MLSNTDSTLGENTYIQIKNMVFLALLCMKYGSLLCISAKGQSLVPGQLVLLVKVRAEGWHNFSKVTFESNTETSIFGVSLASAYDWEFI